MPRRGSTTAPPSLAMVARREAHARRSSAPARRTAVDHRFAVLGRPTLLPGLVLLLACTSAEPPPPDPMPAPTPPPTARVEAKPVAPPPVPQADPDIEDLDPTGALVPAPTTDPIAAALAPVNPHGVVIVDRKAIGKDTIVLFAIDVIATRESDSDFPCDSVEQRMQSCLTACGRDRCDTAQRAACNPTDPYEELTCRRSEDSFAWELARVHESATGVEIRARTRVWGPAPGSLPAADVAHKFQIYDVDRDKRSEVTVIVPIAVTAREDDPEEGDGEVGAIFDASDLHLQLAVTRRLDTRRADVFDSESHAETTWVAKDLDSDGFADLTLTAKRTDKDNNGCDVECDDEEAAERPRRTRAKQVCPYEIAGDRWVCPSPQLGLELLAGNDGVQPIVGTP